MNQMEQGNILFIRIVYKAGNKVRVFVWFLGCSRMTMMKDPPRSSPSVSVKQRHSPKMAQGGVFLNSKCSQTGSKRAPETSYWPREK